MNCNGIENRLPAYLEDLLPPEEKEVIVAHLASCPRCSRALEDMKATERIVCGLEEVEPPPFFEQRIMARVREEAVRKPGILRRLFYPLHIKVPIQALATVLIAVFAFYVYQTGDPELKRMAPLPVPVAGPEQEKVQAESPKSALSPSVAPVKETVQSESARPAATPPPPAPVTRARAGDLSEKDRQQFAAPPLEKGTKEERMTGSRAPLRESRPAAAEQAAPVAAAKDKEIAPAGGQLASQPREGIGKRDADQALEALPAEQKRKERMADAAAAAGESRKAMSAPAAPQMAARADLKRSALDLTIQVRDLARAVREIEARLDEAGARIIERRRVGGGEFLKIEIAARNVAAFQDLLKGIGEVNPKSQSPSAPDENVIVVIHIVGRP